MFRLTIAGLVPLLLMAQGGTRPIINTFAGSNFVGDGGPATAALLFQPEGLAVDTAGNILVSDAADHRVRRILSNGTIQTVAGNGSPGSSGDNGPAKDARLNTPYGLAADRAGNVYVADLSNARVRRIRPDGTIVTVAGSGNSVPQAAATLAATDAKLDSPRNLAVDSDGNLYIADFGGQRIYRVTPTGVLSIVAGSGSAGFGGDNGPATAAKLAYPAGLAVDRNGSLLIADSGNKRIRRVTAGIITTLPNLTLDTPTGIAVDQQNLIYVADGRDTTLVVTPAGQTVALQLGSREIAFDHSSLPISIHRRTVQRYSAQGAILVAGSFGALAAGDGQTATSARLNGPIGLARDPGGSILIGDAHNRRVRIVDGSSVIRTLVDGLEYAPYVAVDSRGTVYISETAAHRIRRVTPGGIVRVLAGTGEAGSAGDGSPAQNAPLSGPTAIALDSTDNIYVADTGNNVVRKITPDGRMTRLAGGGVSDTDGPALDVKLAAPSGVAVDGKGNLFISEADSGRIRKLTAEGWLVTLARNLSEPRGLRVAANGDIFFAETGANRIRRISVSGELTTIAGTGAAGFDGDGGPAAEAILNAPVDVVLDGIGTIWFSDTANNRIRRISLPAEPAPAPQPLPVPQPAPAPQPSPAPQPPAPLEEELTIVHGATLQSQAVAVGQIISIFGQDLGPTDAVIGKLKAAGTLETEVNQTQVLINGAPAPIYYAHSRQLNVQVPNAAFGSDQVEVVVNRDGKVRGRGRLRIRASAPGILTRGSGTGLAAAVNQDGSVNSFDAPVPRGEVITLFATGDGALGIEDGRVATNAVPLLKTVYVHVEGVPAEILYAGRAPGLVGVMQINLRVPQFLPLVGGARLLLHIDGEVSQPGVFVQIR